MKKILCFGDSNTWGHNPVDGSQLERPWPRVLSDMADEWDIEDDGLCGRTTCFDIPGDAGKNGREAFEQYLHRDTPADLLVIMLGTNDTLNFFTPSAKQTADALSEYVKSYREKFPSAAVLLVSPILIREEALLHPVFSDLYSQKSVEEARKFGSEIKMAAEHTGAYFLNAADFAQASDIDGIHMTEEEHEKLALALFDKIREIFDESIEK